MNFSFFKKPNVDVAPTVAIVPAPAIMISHDKIITLVMEDTGATHTIGQSHPNHGEIMEAISYKDWGLLPDLVDIPAAVARYTGDNIIVNEFGEVTYQGVPIHNTVTERITQFYRDNLPFEPLVKFLENLMANPSSRAVSELYGFLENEGMAITEDGCFIGYKGVNNDFTDCHTGTFDNSPGQVHEMPRNLVDDDARMSCSNGFHIGSMQYARGFGAVVLLVKVNPADAVSVPYADAHKLRACRYEVIKVAEGLLEEPLYVQESPPITIQPRHFGVEEEEEEEEDRCFLCDETEYDCEC